MLGAPRWGNCEVPEQTVEDGRGEVGAGNNEGEVVERKEERLRYR